MGIESLADFNFLTAKAQGRKGAKNAKDAKDAKEAGLVRYLCSRSRFASLAFFAPLR